MVMSVRRKTSRDETDRRRLLLQREGAGRCPRKVMFEHTPEERESWDERIWKG